MELEGKIKERGHAGREGPQERAPVSASAHILHLEINKTSVANPNKIKHGSGFGSKILLA